MSKKPDGGPAWPVAWEDTDGKMVAEPGMSLRDWFAGQAGDEANRLLIQYFGDDWMGSCLEDNIKKLVQTKGTIADAMIAERDKS